MSNLASELRSIFFSRRQSAPSNDALRAHVLRRLTMTPHPGEVAATGGTDPQDLALEIIDEAYETSPNSDRILGDAAADDAGAEDFVTAWIDQMALPQAGLADRMAWFWHNHMPSSFDKTKVRFVDQQHHLFRTHGLGNFRDLLQAITIDPAMLHYLDGAGSRGESPNENFAREAMELFALGVGNYTEDDIRVAARGLSGWKVDYDTNQVEFNADEHYDRPLRFFGERRRWTNESIVDKICDQPACARHVARSMYRHIVGGEPTPDRLDQLATTFRSNDLEIRPLLEALVTSPEFLTGVGNRARSAIEYVLATIAIVGADSLQPDPWRMWQLGQVPWFPPNVAGWPGDERWLTGTQVLARTNLLFQTELTDRIINRVEPTVDAVLEHCSLFDVSESTRSAMSDAADNLPFDRTLELLLGLAMTSPEFALA